MMMFPCSPCPFARIQTLVPTPTKAMLIFVEACIPLIPLFIVKEFVAQLILL